MNNSTVSADTNTNNTRRFIQQEIDSFLKKKASAGNGINSGESTASIPNKALNTSDLDKQGARIRSKSRGKAAANTTSRSKERVKLRSTVVDITPTANIEEMI